jgi:hypothetical protein
MPKVANKRERIAAARRLLGLGETASLTEVREAYRHKAKRHHPDLAPQAGEEPPVAMHLLTEAYQTILAYCHAYRIPLEPGAGEEEDDEDWWLKRFGQDPLWGKIRD